MQKSIFSILLEIITNYLNVSHIIFSHDLNVSNFL